MKWASKITIDRGTVEGVTQFTLTYDEGVQEVYAEQYSSRTGVGNQAPNVIYHESGNGDRTPVQITDQNKEIYLETAVLGDTANDVIVKVTALKLAIRESERANSGGRAVEVAITPDGSAYTTYYKILHGYVDDSHAYYQDGDASGQQIAKDIVIALTCEPFGCGDTFTLANALVSSPHMIVDTNADGLADGLVLNGTPATVDIWTANYLTGGKSQRIITNAAGGEGISTANVTASTSSTAVAYAWVSHSSGDAVTVRLTDGSGNIIQTKDLLHSDSTGVSDKSTKGPGGALWHRVVVTGSNTTAANFRLDVVRRSAIATQTTNFLVDNLYMAVGATTAPPAFSGAKTLTNNGINHLDFWGIPGDVPALINMGLTKTGTNDEGFIFGRRTDGKQLANAIRYRIESSTFAGGVFSVSSNYVRASSTGVSGTYFANADNITPADDGTLTARAIGDTIFKLYVVARSSATANTLYGQYSANGSTMIDTDTASATTADTWELWDLGIVNPTGLVVNTSGTSSFYLQFQATVTGTLDIDYAILLPVGDEYLIVDGNPGAISGTLRQITYTVGYTASFLSTWRGSMWQIPAGPQMTRLVYHDFGADNAVTVGNTLAISATITPRTSHLLGVS